MTVSFRFIDLLKANTSGTTPHSRFPAWEPNLTPEVKGITLTGRTASFKV